MVGAIGALVLYAILLLDATTAFAHCGSAEHNGRLAVASVELTPDQRLVLKEITLAPDDAVVLERMIVRQQKEEQILKDAETLRLYGWLEE